MSLYSFLFPGPKGLFINQSVNDAQKNFDAVIPEFGGDKNDPYNPLSVYADAVKNYIQTSKGDSVFLNEAIPMYEAANDCLKHAMKAEGAAYSGRFMELALNSASYIVVVGRQKVHNEDVNPLFQRSAWAGASDVQMMEPALDLGLGKEVDAYDTLTFFNQQQDDIFQGKRMKENMAQHAISEEQVNAIAEKIYILNELSLQLVRNANYENINQKGVYYDGRVKAFETRDYNRAFKKSLVNA